MWGRGARDAHRIATQAAHKQPGQRLGPALGLAAVAGVTAVDVATAPALAGRDRRRSQPHVDYSDRSGFPRAPAQMRGAASKTFETPPEMRNELPQIPQPQVELNM
jgi:hypothetical protein